MEKRKQKTLNSDKKRTLIQLENRPETKRYQHASWPVDRLR